MKPFCGIWQHYTDDDPDHIYRAIAPGHEHLLEVAKKMPLFHPFEMTDRKIDVGAHKQIPMVRSKRIPFQIRIQEMTRKQALASCRALVQMVRDGERLGFIPADIHESNFLWWNGPIFVDLDAIEPAHNEHYAMAFVRIAALMLRYVYRRDVPTPCNFDVNALAAQGGWAGQQAKHGRDWADPRLWKDFAHVLANIQVDVKPGYWATNYAKDFKAIQKNDKFQRSIAMIPPGKTLLDVGCNWGYLGEMVKDRFTYMSGFDLEEACINEAPQNETTSYAYFGFQAFDNPKHNPPMTSRYEADVVTALAVTHHFKDHGMKIGYIANTLADLTKRHLLIEDIHGGPKYDAVFKSRGMTLVERQDSYPRGRKLSLWQQRGV